MAKQQDKTNADIKDMSFEQALKELEQIVGRLERGDVELEQSIAIYERGEALRDHCDRLLQRAEAKVEKINLSEDGQPTGTQPLDVE
jgi:exodeoxyribonuclease VII small subunit